MQVNDIIQDAKGYIWVATNGGLSKFDGRKFVSFTAQDGLGSNKCLRLFCDSKGRIWVSHIYGLSLVSGKVIKSFHDSDGVKCREIAAFVEHEGAIIMGGFDGLVIYNGKSFTSYSIPNTNSFQIRALVFDDNQKLYVGFGNKGGLYKSNDETYKSFSQQTILLGSEQESVIALELRGKQLFVYGAGGIYSLTKGKFVRQTLVGMYLGLEDLATKADKSRWMATPNGLGILEQGKIVYLNELNGLASSELSTVFCDKEQNVWIGGKNGLDLLTSRIFKHYGVRQGLTGFAPTALSEDSKGRIFFNSEPNGLFCYDDGVISKVKQFKQLDEHFFSCISTDNTGNIWLGTADFSGVFLINGSKIKQFTTDDGLIDNNIKCLVSGTTGEIWAGTSKGLCFYRNQSWQAIESPNGFINFDIRALHFDENGALWIGTSEGNLFKYKAGKYTQIKELGGLMLSAINCITSNRNAVYFTSESSGLGILENNKLSLLGRETGLATDEFRFVLHGKENQLYCGTAKGLLVLKLKGSSHVFSKKLYGKGDGFAGEECLNGSAIISNDGNVWIGTPIGVSVYNPEEAQLNLSPPDIDITSISLFFKEPNWKDYTKDISPETSFGINPVFPYDQNYISFKFSGLNFSSLHGLRYKWKLEGFEKEWNPSLVSNEAIFSNLPPGDYTFRVIAISGSGIESNEAKYSFNIAPPFWRTIWFYGFLLVLFASTLVGYVKFRERKLVQEKHQLEAAVELRTLELQEQKSIVEQKNTDIMDNIRYARNIQFAILPSQEEIAKSFSEHFILFKPQNIVSGDLYWFYRMGNMAWAAAIDCTGHGVPGAFMSMMANDLLNQAIIEKKINNPAGVLSEINRSIRLVFKEENLIVENQQGMDVALVCIDLDTKLMKFAGAMRPMLGIVNNEILEWDGDKASIGRYTEEKFEFTNHELVLKANDAIFMMSDGYCDQFGGPKGRKLMSVRFKDTIQANIDKPMKGIGNELEHTLNTWQGQLEQVDDILVWGIRV